MAEEGSVVGERRVAGEIPNTTSAKLARIWRHRWSTERRLAKVFDAAAFEAIEAAIAEGERTHRAEVRFALEADLDLFELARDLGTRERAMAVFAEQGIWDTEENSGVLIYLLWADRAVEVIADRGVEAFAPDGLWQRCCDRIAEGCRRPATSDVNAAVESVVSAIREINRALAESMPTSVDNPNELLDRPIRL